MNMKNLKESPWAPILLSTLLQRKGSQINLKFRIQDFRTQDRFVFELEIQAQVQL